MKLSLLAFVVAQVLLCSCRILNQLPAPCSKSDPDVEGCLRKAAEQLKHHLASGMPEYNFPAADPYEQDIFYIKRDLLFADIDAVLKNLKITGLVNYYFDDFKADIKNLHGKASVIHPQIKVQTDFNIKGNVLGIPLEFSGFVAAEFVDIKTNVSVNFHTRSQGVKPIYYVMDDLDIKTKIGYMHAIFTAANPEDQAIADLIGKTLTENDRSILDLLTPSLNSVSEEFARERVAKLLDAIPAERFLTE